MASGEIPLRQNDSLLVKDNHDCEVNLEIFYNEDALLPVKKPSSTDLTLWQSQTTRRKYSQESGPGQPSGNSTELHHTVVCDNPEVVPEEVNVEQDKTALKGPRKGKKRKRGGRLTKSAKKQRGSQEQAKVDQVESTFSQSGASEALNQAVQTDPATACSPTSISVGDRNAVVSVEGARDASLEPPSEMTITTPSVGDEACRLEGTAKTFSLIPYVCNQKKGETEALSMFVMIEKYLCDISGLIKGENYVRALKVVLFQA